MRKSRGLLATLSPAVFVTAFLVNPAFFAGGCSKKPAYQFGETEMVDVLAQAKAAGPYRFTSIRGELEVTFKVEQRRGDDSTDEQSSVAATREAHACGMRSFLKSAAACLDTTKLLLDGTVTVREIATNTKLLDEAPVYGALFVEGKHLDNGRIELVATNAKYVIYLRSTDGQSFKVDSVKENDRRL